MVVSDNIEDNLLGLQIFTMLTRLRRIIFIEHHLVQFSFKYSHSTLALHSLYLYINCLYKPFPVWGRSGHKYKNSLYCLLIVWLWSKQSRNKKIDIIKTKPLYCCRNKISGYINVILLIWISVSLLKLINCDWVGLNCQSRKPEVIHFG